MGEGPSTVQESWRRSRRTVGGGWNGRGRRARSRGRRNVGVSVDIAVGVDGSVGEGNGVVGRFGRTVGLAVGVRAWATGAVGTGVGKAVAVGVGLGNGMGVATGPAPWHANNSSVRVVAIHHQRARRVAAVLPLTSRLFAAHCRVHWPRKASHTCTRCGLGVWMYSKNCWRGMVFRMCRGSHQARRARATPKRR